MLVNARVSLLLVLATALAPIPARAQGRDVDDGTFLIRAGRQLIGRETFRIRRQPLPNGLGFAITTSAAYPASGRAVTSAIVELGPDSLPLTVQLDAGPNRRILARVGMRRITVRTMTPSGEAAREFAGAPRTLIVDDSLLATYAILPGAAAGSVMLFAPRDGTHQRGRLQDLGTERIVIAGKPQATRHVRLGGPDGGVDLWFATDGRLLKVDLQRLGVTAVRAGAGD